MCVALVGDFPPTAVAAGSQPDWLGSGGSGGFGRLSLQCEAPVR